MLPPVLKLSVLQFAPRLRDPAANLGRILEAAASSAADVLLTPELALTGYDLQDDVPHLALAVERGAPLGLPEARGPARAPDRTHVVLGMVERGQGGPYNAAVVLQDGLVLFEHRKVYLPTYGMFDEGRHFGRGLDVEPWDAGGGWRIGILICEDFWHPGLAYGLAAAGIHALLVLAAAPGRGVWNAGERGGMFASADVWERIARTTAQLYGIYVALGNRVGVEGGVTFAGGSFVVSPTGDVLARAPDAGTCLLDAELALDEVERARQPYSHARDDDPRIVGRLLQRLS